jgi:hypothetical protein
LPARVADAQRFADGKQYRARVIFAGEPPQPTPSAPVLPSPRE